MYNFCNIISITGNITSKSRNLTEIITDAIQQPLATDDNCDDFVPDVETGSFGFKLPEIYAAL